MLSSQIPDVAIPKQSFVWERELISLGLQVMLPLCVICLSLCVCVCEMLQTTIGEKSENLVKVLHKLLNQIIYYTYTFFIYFFFWSCSTFVPLRMFLMIIMFRYQVGVETEVYILRCIHLC